MNKDIIVKDDNIYFNCRCCAIIIYNQQLLVQKREDDLYWALPGGKIKIGESSFEAIHRELFEELKIDNITKAELVDVNEYFFTDNNYLCHQNIFTYFIQLDDYSMIAESNLKDICEAGLIFKWYSIDNISSKDIKPDYLKEQILPNKVRKLNRIYRED